jgi:hypothetical protein
MALENPRWGAKKIHKLEIVVHKRTIQKYGTLIVGNMH